MGRSGGGFGSGLIVGLFLGIGAAVIFGNQIKGALSGVGSGGIAKSFATTYPGRHLGWTVHPGHPQPHTSHWGGLPRVNGG